MRRLCVWSLLAAPALAGDRLDALLDPAAEPLEPLSRRAFEALDGDDRLRARGIEPALHVAPPDVPGAVEQARNIRGRLVPGFRYAKRLATKREKTLRALRRVPPYRLPWLVARLRAWSPEAFVAKYGHLARDADRNRFARQPLQALRHSERQYRAWLLGEIAARMNDMEPPKRAVALDGLVRGLEHRDPVRRRHCAEVLGRVRDPLAASALERAVDREEDASVLAALVHGRARHGGKRLGRLLRRWAGRDDEALRRAVVRECALREDAGDAPFLRELFESARGRLRDDVLAAWPAGGPERPGTRGEIAFYGIETHSRRVLFCIDVSGSMAWPMDGMDGTRERRIDKTRRELFRTISELPAGTEFNVAMFAGRPVPWRRELVPATPESREAAIGFIEETGILPGTNLYRALDFAFESGADTVFVLTDGEPNGGVILDPALLIEEIAARNAHGALRIHAIGLSLDQNAELLANLAARTGGRYVASH